MRYLGNFTNQEILPKIYSAYSLGINVARAIIVMAGSTLLGIMTGELAAVLAGIIATLVVVVILKYMKSRIGLKPEEYDKKEIKYDSLYEK